MYLVYSEPEIKYYSYWILPNDLYIPETQQEIKKESNLINNTKSKINLKDYFPYIFLLLIIYLLTRKND